MLIFGSFSFYYSVEKKNSVVMGAWKIIISTLQPEKPALRLSVKVTSQAECIRNVSFTAEGGL